ncbi:MAG: transglutaminase family protein [Spirosomataceae bacterium]|jgi:transglutaminase-like putative cysteine protease
MIFEVEHRLKYSYSDYVGLNPHYLYLNPRPTPFQQILDCHLTILPKPDLLVKNIDQESNIQQLCYVNQMLKTFEVFSKFKIQSEPFHALNFVFFPFESAKIPFRYPGKLALNIEAILGNKRVDTSVKDFANQIAQKAKFDTIDFLMELTTEIHRKFEYVSRERGDANPGYLTLKTMQGSCRDFSVLMMEACAAVGLLSRFISGYLYGSELHQHDLHAWVEVLLPGGGWRGFDPTEGRVVDHNYIALASSIEDRGLTPIRGTFRSSSVVESMLDTQVIIKALKE